MTLVESHADLLDGDGGEVDTVLAGDVLYDRSISQRMLAFLERVAARGVEVLLGDPGRGYLPYDRFEVVASYQVPQDDVFADALLTKINVVRPRH